MDEFKTLSDPQLIEERRRVRRALERLPAGHERRFDLAAQLDAMTAELDHRAAIAWGETTA